MHHLAVALLLHDLKHGLRHEEQALEVDVHHAVPALVGDVGDGGGAGDARDVHEHVDAAIDRARRGDFLGDVVEVGDVELDGGSFLALGLQTLGHSRGRGQIQIGQNDLRAEVHQTAGGRLADAAAAAGHHGHLALH